MASRSLCLFNSSDSVASPGTPPRITTFDAAAGFANAAILGCVDATFGFGLSIGFFPIVGFGLSVGLLAVTAGFGAVAGLVGEGAVDRVIEDRGLGFGVGRGGIERCAMTAVQSTSIFDARQADCYFLSMSLNLERKLMEEQKEWKERFKKKKKQNEAVRHLFSALAPFSSPCCFSLRLHTAGGFMRMLSDVKLVCTPAYTSGAMRHAVCPLFLSSFFLFSFFSPLLFSLFLGGICVVLISTRPAVPAVVHESSQYQLVVDLRTPGHYSADVCPHPPSHLSTCHHHHQST